MKFWVDTSMYFQVEANSKEEAEDVFWNQVIKAIHDKEIFSGKTIPAFNDVWEITTIEEDND